MKLFHFSRSKRISRQINNFTFILRYFVFIWLGKHRFFRNFQSLKCVWLLSVTWSEYDNHWYIFRVLFNQSEFCMVFVIFWYIQTNINIWDNYFLEIGVMLRFNSIWFSFLIVLLFQNSLTAYSELYILIKNTEC